MDPAGRQAENDIADLDALRSALGTALDDGLRQFAAPTSNDWPTLRAQLLGPLDDDDRRLLIAKVGVGEPPQPRRAPGAIRGRSPSSAPASASHRKP